MRQEITAEEYLKDPCGASSLPFWKTEQTEIPQGMKIVPEDQFDAAACKGTAYTKAELESIAAVCREYRMSLYLDGARLAYGLMSHDTDLTLSDIARLCDVFYIGGTKVGPISGK